jgi:hypothetical protein
MRDRYSAEGTSWMSAPSVNDPLTNDSIRVAPQFERRKHSLARGLVASSALLGTAAFLLGDGALAALLLVLAVILAAASVVASRRAALWIIGTLVVGHASFTVDFAKLAVSVGGLPIYVTDAALGAVLLGSLLSGRLRPGKEKLFFAAITGLVLTGGALALAAIAAGAEFDLVLRQSALFYYPLAALAVAANARLEEDRVLVISIVVIGAVLAIAVTGLNVVTGASQLTDDAAIRYVRGDVGVFLAIIALVSLLADARDFPRNVALTTGAALALGGVLLSQHRSVWLALAIAYAAAALLRFSGQKARRAAAILAPLLVFGIMAALTDPDGIVAGTVARLQTTTDPTAPDAAWRLAAWNQTLEDIGNHPVIGVGLGQLFSFSFRGVTVTEFPHNSLLDIAWYAGALGLTLFCLGQVVFVVRLFGQQDALLRNGWSVQLLFGAWLVVLIATCFNVLLENPYGAIPFWTIVGVPFAASSERKPARRSVADIMSSKKVSTAPMTPHASH